MKLFAWHSLRSISARGNPGGFVIVAAENREEAIELSVAVAVKTETFSSFGHKSEEEFHDAFRSELLKTEPLVKDAPQSVIISFGED